MKKKIVILTSNYFYGIDVILMELWKFKNDFDICVYESKEKKGLFKTLRRNGLKLSYFKYKHLRKQMSLKEVCNICGFKYLNLKEDGDILLSIGYMSKIPQSVIDNFDIAVNLHPSLLPQYGGLNPIYRAWEDYENGGVTLHYLSDEYDSGEVIKQKKVFYKLYGWEQRLNLKSCYDSTALASTQLLSEYLKEMI